MKRRLKPTLAKGLYQDAAIIAASIVVAYLLLKSDVLTQILHSTTEYQQFGAFIAGLFFTSLLTTAPAIVTFAQMSEVYSPFTTAFFGALGAVIGDLIIFQFVKDRFSAHVMELIKHRKPGKQLMHLFKVRAFRWFTFLVGGLIIASPLPDELGITLLGFSKMKSSGFVILSFVFNFLGILLIGLTAQTLL